MEIKDVKKMQKKEVVMSIRTTKEKSEWMGKHNISPAMLFDLAVEELMEKENNRISKRIETSGIDAITERLVGKRR